MFSSIAAKLNRQLSSRANMPTKPQPQRTTYTSNPVDIPSSFLKTPPIAPITYKHIDFGNSPLPEYTNCFAIVIDNVLAPWECDQLLKLAEQSVPLAKESDSAWRPALVNVGVGVEMPITDYRNSDRIIWDQQAVADRIWQRCLQARQSEDEGEGEGSSGGSESVEAMLSKTPEDGGENGDWKFERLNERMRFLKYTKGQFFKRESFTLHSRFQEKFYILTRYKAHCDGPYYYTDNGTEVQTHYTLHLYLSDSAKTSETGEGCVGGATSFLSRDLKRRLDVDPKAGSVLVFQHRRLMHQGDEVHKGTKYTMRTDILYRWVQK